MSQAQVSRDKLAADFQAVMEDIEALIGAEGEKAESEVKALRARIRDKLDQTRRTVAHFQEESFERAREAARKTDDYVHDHPWQAVGVGAALGLVIGVLIGRR